MFKGDYKIKILSFAVATALSFSSFTALVTNAYFSDSATMEGTVFSAGTLSISITPESDFATVLMYPSDATSTSISLLNTGSLNSQYVASTTILSGADACGYVTLVAIGSNGASFSGHLGEFKSEATTTVTTDWDYDFTIDPNTSPSVWGKTCEFKLTYTAWQENLADASEGFSDVKEITGHINIGKAVVMNEILPNPEGDDDQEGLQGEWVELYNNSNIAVELNTWKIADDDGHIKLISASNTWNGRTKMGAKGSGLEWVVVFMNTSIMNDGGDQISFYDSTDILVDRYTFGNSQTDEDSDSNNTGSGDNNNPTGDETAGNEGKSYARLPEDGTGAWVDPVPTPGLPNIFSEMLEPLVLDQPEIEKSPELQSNIGEIGEATSTSAVMATSTEEIIASSTDEVVATSTSETDEDEIDATATTTEDLIEEENDETASSTETVIEKGKTEEEIESTEPASVIIETPTQETPASEPPVADSNDPISTE